MNLIKKIVLPLIDKEITLEDISKDAGFYGFYFYDKNRPSLDNHVFLVYDLEVKTKQTFNRDVKFRKLKNIYSEKVIYHKGKPLKIYTFCIINSDIKNVINKLTYPKDVNNVVHILSFWRGYDTEVTNAIFAHFPNKYNADWESVPEADFQQCPQIGYALKQKSGAIGLSYSPALFL